jgi:hypothetical protein
VENSEWRDLLLSLRGEPGSLVVKDVTIAPRLSPFALSQTYGDQAKAITIRFMGRLSDPDGFQDLFSYVFPTVNMKNLTSVVNVGRELNKTIKKLENQCFSITQEYNDPDPDHILWGCASSISDKEFTKMTIDNDTERKRLESPRQAVKDLNLEAFFLSQQLVPFLQTVYRTDIPNNSKQNLDFSNMYILNGNLSNTDLSQWDLRNTIFGFVDLSGSDLTVSVSKFEGSEFRSCNWWDAKAIDADLLLSLIKYSYPYRFLGIYYPVNINKENYIEKVRRLCALAHAKCPAELDFGQP